MGGCGYLIVLRAKDIDKKTLLHESISENGAKQLWTGDAINSPQASLFYLSDACAFFASPSNLNFFDIHPAECAPPVVWIPKSVGPRDWGCNPVSETANGNMHISRQKIQL